MWPRNLRSAPIRRVDYPEKLARGLRERQQQVAITMDLTASIVAATGTVLPTGHRLDGINILPSVAGEAPVVDRQLFWRIARPERQQKAARSGQWKLLVDGNHFLLFDLRDDVGERRDLAAQHPELVLKLKELLAEWEKDVDQKPS